MPIETELLTGPIRGLNTIAWWAVFLLCAVGLSWVFETFKQFTLVPNLTNGLLLAGAFFILLGAFVLLLYDSYAKEKQKDKITRPFALFEAWYHRKR
ncbi:MAG: hypothetical protein VKJ06_09260 [Vampirovibrionales bacterium]|nr:hypothetical protein [Vampirovibrionales bacterium]